MTPHSSPASMNVRQRGFGERRARIEVALLQRDEPECRLRVRLPDDVAEVPLDVDGLLQELPGRSELVGEQMGEGKVVLALGLASAIPEFAVDGKALLVRPAELSPGRW